MILHHHFEKLSSTQKYLKEHLEGLSLDSSRILISTDLQTNGIGRRNKSWHHKENALAFSFTLPTSNKKSIISLEMVVLLVLFLKNKGYEISLKWPNDLLNKKGQKCGGVIIHLLKDIFIVGVGINWGICSFEEECQYIPGVLDESRTLLKQDYRNIPFLIYNYILNHRLSEQEIQKKWMEFCIHMGKSVKISENNKVFEGVFTGVGTCGEAMLINQNETKSFFTGSLSLGRLGVQDGFR